MDILTREDLRKLVVQPEAPCVSLYQPTHRGGAEEDPIHWKNLLNQAEKRLRDEGMSPHFIKQMLAPAWTLHGDDMFWRNQGDGLACFIAPNMMRMWRVPLRFNDLLVVGDRCHVTPLLPLLASNNRFYLLAISQKQLRVFQGNGLSVHEVDLTRVPRSLAQALRFHEQPLLYPTPPKGGRGWGAVFGGQGADLAEHKKELLRYFQIVDHGLRELLRNEQAPLVLASVEYLWPIYREANTYPHLLETGVAGNPDQLNPRDLHQRAWALVKARLEQLGKKMAALYDRTVGTGRTASGLEAVLRAATHGEVDTLFVAQDQECWGKFDSQTGTVSVHERKEAGDQDLLNLAAVQTLLYRGNVFPVAANEVPGGQRLAALVRVSTAAPVLVS